MAKVPAEAKTKKKYSIKHKITLFILLSFFVFGVLGLSLIYRIEYNLLNQTISRDYLLLAKSLGSAMNRIITREIRSTQTFMTSSERLLMVKQHNLKYAGMSEQAKEAYFKEMDQKWETAKDQDVLITEYTQSAAGRRLREITENDPSIAEIFLTDKYGGLVAASGRTSDFFQADEVWWQKSFNQGKGQIFIDPVVLDASSNAISFSIALPIKNESQEVIGICKNILEVDRLFEPLKNFNFGISGYVGLLDKEGYFIFHPRVKPMSYKLPDKVLRMFNYQDQGYVMIDQNDNLHRKAAGYYFSKIKHPVLSQSGEEWWICIAQNKDEIFAPLSRLILNFTLAIIFMSVITAVIGFYFAKLLVTPILKLRDALGKAAGGDFNSQVEIKTNDEIGELGESFNSMLDEIKRGFINIEVLNREIALRKNTEQTLRLSEERYRKLFTESKEAILIFSPEEGFLSGNPAAVKLFACRDEKELGMMKLADLSPERQPDGSLSVDLSKQMVFFAEKNGAHKFKWMHRRLNGEDFSAEVMLSKFETAGKVLMQTTIREIQE